MKGVGATLADARLVAAVGTATRPDREHVDDTLGILAIENHAPLTDPQSP